jgi:hypothetical protein
MATTKNERFTHVRQIREQARSLAASIVSDKDLLQGEKGKKVRCNLARKSPLYCLCTEALAILQKGEFC